MCLSVTLTMSSSVKCLKINIFATIYFEKLSKSFFLMFHLLKHDLFIISFASCYVIKTWNFQIIGLKKCYNALYFKNGNFHF